MSNTSASTFALISQGYTLVEVEREIFKLSLLNLRVEGADIFLDYLSDQSKSMSVLYRTQIS